MNNKKRMMYLVDEDYYFIIIKILLILDALGRGKSKFIDYRKLSFIIEFIKDDSTMKLFRKSIEHNKSSKLHIDERLFTVYYNANMQQALIKRVLFFLEKRQLIVLFKNDKYACIDVSIVDNKEINEVLSSSIFNEDKEHINEIRQNINKIKSIKYDTFIEKVFGNREVSKWDI